MGEHGSARTRWALDELAAGAENVDVKALAGAAPWLRLRAGDWRVLYRPLTEQEAATGGAGFLVVRVVNRRRRVPRRAGRQPAAQGSSSRVVNRRGLLRAVRSLGT